jgi:hypothetical protein
MACVANSGHYLYISRNILFLREKMILLKVIKLLLVLNQEVLRPVSNNASAHHGQSPGVSSRIRHDDSQETGVPKSLNEKLASRVDLNGVSPQHGQSIESYTSSNVRDEENKETVKSLNEKLAAALLTISDKEDLVKQHAKVTEEAVAGNLFSFLEHYQ